MEPDDPFGWITEACQMPSSEESRLRRCPYFGQSDSDDSVSDSGWRNAPDIPIALSDIKMVSPQESPQDELPNDLYTLPLAQEIFHTPPESRSTSTSFNNCNDDRMFGYGLDSDGETVVVDADSSDSKRTVDLWRDTDLGFLEVEVDSTQRIEADGTFRRESEEIRISKRGFSPKGELSTGSPSKRLKSLNFESLSKQGTPRKRNTDSLKINLSFGDSSELEPGNQQNDECNGELREGSVRKRRIGFESEERNINNAEISSRGKNLEFSTGDIECDTEERNIDSENDNGEGNFRRNKNIVEDIDQVRYTGVNGSNSYGMEEKTERKRALPSCANNGRVWDDESADESTDEELEANEMQLPSWANGRAGDDERADEELEVNEMELPSFTNGRVGDDEGADEKLDVNERDTVHLDMDSDSLSEDFEEITLLDVLMKLEEDCEDRNLECLSLLEVSETKWGTVSSDL